MNRLQWASFLLTVMALATLTATPAMAQQAANPPSPFGAPAAAPAQSPFQPTPPVATQPAPATPPQQVVVMAPQPGPAPMVDHMRMRGARALGTGIGLLVLSAIPLGIGGGLVDDWEACEWDGDTYQCGETASYLGSILLFTFGGIIAVAGLALVPVGAARLSRASRRNGQRRRWVGSLSPFASPTRSGGAVFGVSGLLF